MVDLPSGPLAGIDPEFERMALETGEFTFGLTGTSVREKLLQDVCRAQTGLALRMHVVGSKMYGIPYPDLLALIRFVAPYAGYPAAADALARVREVAAEIGMDTSDVGEPPAALPGYADSLSTGDEWMAEFLRSRFTRAWSGHRLSERERAIVAITVDVSMQTLGESFRLHVRRALDAGVSEAEVRDVVRFCAEHGVGRAVAALRELTGVFTEPRPS